MLTAEQNRKFVEVGPGTPMGEVLRRHWMPISAETQFDDVSVRPVRLLGEDLVLYKDLSGTYGLVDRHCPHRRADLSYGFVEQCGLRCNYHGWRFDETGRCIEQPYDDLANPKGHFKDKIKTTAYPVQAHAGLIWAYMGPQPAPLLPDWEPFNWKHGFRQIVFAEVPCNWFQCQENSIDPVHFEWMHMNWSKRLRGKGEPYGPRHLKVDFDEHPYGFIYKRVREDTDEQHPMWTTGRVCLWPNGFYLGDHFEWRVPIDDFNTLSVTWAFNRVPPSREPFEQNAIPSWWGPIRDEETGQWISSHVINQDIIAWVGQGVIADRTKENIGPSDRGIAMMRRQFLRDMETVAAGGDPKAVIRDPAESKNIKLPVAERKLLEDGVEVDELQRHPVMKEHLQHFMFHAGQPPEIWEAYLQAMGLRDLGIGASE